MLLAGGWACANCFLLATVVYDQEVAMGKSLCYTTCVGPHICTGLVAECWLGGFTVATGMCGTIL